MSQRQWGINFRGMGANSAIELWKIHASEKSYKSKH